MVNLRSGNTPNKATPPAKATPRRVGSASPGRGTPKTTKSKSPIKSPTGNITVSLSPLKRGRGRPKKVVAAAEDDDGGDNSDSSESIIRDVHHDDDFVLGPDVNDWQTMLGIRQRTVMHVTSGDDDAGGGYGEEESVSLAKRTYNGVRAALGDPTAITRALPFIMLMEATICAVIIWKVKYTEIDWTTYMEQAAAFWRDGQYNYTMIGGATGPIVYPAGHLYIYTALSFVTRFGADVLRAQCIFAALYMANVYIVMRIYAKVAEVPLVYLLPLTVTAYRVHSISVLRMFNDPLAMLVLHAALLMLLNQRSTCACILYSVAVSIKMNILLMAPALGALLVVSEGWTRAVMHGVNCAVVQVILAAPFLYRAPCAYVHAAFDMGRVFLHEWTVNWRFVPEHVFVDRRAHVALLVAHVVVLVAFAFYKWWPRRGGLAAALMSRVRMPLSAGEMIYALFTANLIGVVFARSLHYQFYVWYYYSLPFLFGRTAMPGVLKFVLPLAIEYAWNVYPSTAASSALLHAVHAALLVGLCAFKGNGDMDTYEKRTRSKLF